MFRKHRDDLLAAHERERAVWRMLVDVLAEQVEFLRYQVMQTPHMSQVIRPVNPTEQPEAGDGPAWLSEEEEDLLALRLNDHISDNDLTALQEELHLRVMPDLEPSE